MISTKYKSQRKWSDSIMDQVRPIIEKYIATIINIETANEYKDTRESTDLVVKTTRSDIAVRVRSWESMQKKDGTQRTHDFTIRSRSYGNGRTELNKLREGYGDWYVYAWCDEYDVIYKYWIIDLKTCHSKGLFHKQRYETLNRGGNTGFVAISRKELRNNKALWYEWEDNGQPVIVGWTT